MSKMKKNKIMIRNIGLFMAIISAFLSAFNVIIEKKYIEYISSESILFLMYLGGEIPEKEYHFCDYKEFKKNYSE